ncbi:TPA: hypothetical protein KOU56_003632 [Clostridioides difficile]|nr:hypothetical protein [Clostridioides difficile]
MIYKDLIKKINDIENLKEVDNIKCSTDTGEYTIENSKKGYLTSFSIEGNTLVNLASTDMFTLEGNSIKEGTFIKLNNSASYVNLASRLNTGIYTLIVNVVDVNISYTIHTILSEGGNKEVFTKNGNQILKLNMDNNIDKLRVYTADSSNTLGIQMVLLEGDYTNTNISYFEGLQSVGQGDDIKLLSYQGKNLFDGTYQDGYFNGNSLEEELIQGMPCITTNWIDCSPNVEYYFLGGNRKQIQFKKGDNIFKSVILNSNNFETPTDCTHFRLYYARTDQFYSPLNIYKKGDIKIIPYTLRGLSSEIKDRIIYKNNGHKLIQRCEEIALNGQENWIQHGNSNDKTLIFYAKVTEGSYNNSDNIELKCNRFKGIRIITNTFTEEGVYENRDGNIYIRILRSRLATQDLTGFKTWLNNNNVTFIRQIETKEIKLVTLNLEQYDNQTKFICNSNTVIPNISFESTQNLGSHIQVIRNNIKNYNVRTDFPFPINFLNGWQPYLGYASSVGNYCTNNNFVTINATINGGVTTAGTIIGKIPSKYAPRKNIIVIFQTTDGKYYNGIIRTNGEIEIYYNDITYRSWLYLYVNYLI